eukprot:m.115293 g.115293  ORF g.115293 m.115293 type:complete len:74 (-) comp10875_c0_seq1:571-792(-)
MEVYVLESIEDGALVKAPTELGRALSRGGVAVMSTMGVAVWSLVAIAGRLHGSTMAIVYLMDACHPVSLPMFH